MKSQFLARLLTTQLLAVSATLAPAGDIDREWEAEIAENLDENTSDGEVIWCQAANSRFLTLYTGQTANLAKGAAIILHGMGAHPDWPEVISPLRTSLPELGWSTLSIQLPVLAPETPVADYGNTLQEAGQRTGAAVRLLHDMGFSHIVIIGHSFGAAIGAEYLAGTTGNDILAFVSIGIQSQKFLNPTLDILARIEKIKIPVLDIYGSRDLESVTATVADRRLAARKGGNHAYQQVEIKDADHSITGFEPVLVKHIRDWLDKTLSAIAIMDEHDRDREIDPAGKEHTT